MIVVISAAATGAATITLYRQLYLKQCKYKQHCPVLTTEFFVQYHLRKFLLDDIL